MFEQEYVRLPTIYVTARDQRRVQALLGNPRRFIPDSVRTVLRRELARAVICKDDAIPPNVVTMNSRVLFRADPDAPTQSRTLIFDDDHSSVGGTVSIVTATGTALLGLREGSHMPYATSDGERRVLILERVAYQPEAQGRVGSDPYRHWPPGSSTIIAFPLRPRPATRRNPDDDPGPGAA
jgi:regulator of nucleoside diphosphate kinase